MRNIAWVNLLLGFWIAVALFALGVARLSAVAMVSDLIVGIVLIASSWRMLARPGPASGKTALQVVCGLWLIVSPFLLRYNRLPTATGNDIAVGVLVIFVAIVQRQLIAGGPPAMA